MMKKKILLLTLVGCLVCLTACTQDYKRETFDYAEMDGQVLRLDVYTDTLDADTAEERPDKAPATKTIEDSFREMTEGQ